MLIKYYAKPSPDYFLGVFLGPKAKGGHGQLFPNFHVVEK